MLKLKLNHVSKRGHRIINKNWNFRIVAIHGNIWPREYYDFSCVMSSRMTCFCSWKIASFPNYAKDHSIISSIQDSTWNKKMVIKMSLIGSPQKAWRPILPHSVHDSIKWTHSGMMYWYCGLRHSSIQTFYKSAWDHHWRPTPVQWIC